RLLGLFLTVAAPALAPAQNRRFDLDALGRLVPIRSVSLSPDGKAILAVVARPSYEENQWQPELVLVDAQSGALRGLAASRSLLAGPAGSPAGDRIAFVARGPADARAPQIWTLPIRGGDARPVPRAPDGVLQFAWSPAGNALAYAREDRPEPR